MQKFCYTFALLIVTISLFSNTEMYSQAVQDPASIPVYQASGTIIVDGILNEADWSATAPHLMFKAGGSPSGTSYTPTGGAIVKPVYKDSSTTYVRFLHSNNKLYISLKSNDKQVCKFDWEGDGMFMVMKDASDKNSELKLYVKSATTFGVETGGAAPIPADGYSGIGVVSGTIYDSSDVDNGYTAEAVVDLSKIGYASLPAAMKCFLNIFDPDNFSTGAAPWGANGNFFKQWWGSEWGSEWRTLNFVNKITPYDPAVLPVYAATAPIIVDGLLNESDWAADVPHLVYKIGGTPSGNEFAPTGGAIVKPVYKDSSTTYVRFLHSNNKLYISLKSNDKQVCKFDWEGDGMFMVMKDASDKNTELKLYVKDATTFGAETGGAAPIPADGYSGIGVVSGTIYDSSNVDNGYTAEAVVDLSKIGYASLPATMKCFLNIFDPDNFSTGAAPWGANGNFAKQWWGSEWGSEWRTLKFELSVVPVELTSFTAKLIGNEVSLNWSTATELNNKGFEIQRSVNNSEFNAVGFVEGNGTTSDVKNYSFVDKTVSANVNYSYRLKQIDFNGAFEYSKQINVGSAVPSQFALQQNYPNPFNPSTKVSFNLPVSSSINLDVYNLIGEKVLTLAAGQFEAGNHSFNVNAAQLSSGIYIYKLNAVGIDGSNFVSSKKMTLLK